MYNINELVMMESSFKEQCNEHFIRFFQEYKNIELSKIIITNIKSHDSISELRYGSGLYLILTDYMANKNPCSYEYDGLKAIYRGHGVRMKKRVESHLFNKEYNQNKDNTNYTVCMKLNSDNGININEKPYSGSRWCVIQHPMTKSSKTIREQAELAFDKVHTMPVGSNA